MQMSNKQFITFARQLKYICSVASFTSTVKVLTLNLDISRKDKISVLNSVCEIQKRSEHHYYLDKNH